MKNAVITIEREFCSGGRNIGKAYAEKYDVPFYDRELIELASKESGISIDEIQKADESMTDSFLYNIALGSSLFGLGDFTSRETLPINEKVYIVQSSIIKQAAATGACVIIGRCGHYVLRDVKRLVRVFIYASMDYRLQTCMKRYDVSEDKAKTMINRVDKRRETYHNRFSESVWRDYNNYDIIINAETADIDTIIDTIRTYAEKKDISSI